MPAHEIDMRIAMYTGRGWEPLVARCPECEAIPRLQSLIAELLSRNQALRHELQEARNRLSARDAVL